MSAPDKPRAGWQPSMPFCCALIRTSVAAPYLCRRRAPIRVRRSTDSRWFYFCPMHRSVAKRVQAGGAP
ncbi:MAG TPA: hypothetical protein VNM34_14870 [Verrucomicrobiae bacterium]|nr:hypothetical protein [Verrucomicrobiae bacterium]